MLQVFKKQILVGVELTALPGDVTLSIDRLDNGSLE